MTTTVIYGVPVRLTLRTTMICHQPVFFFSSSRRHTILTCDWSSDVCSSDLVPAGVEAALSGEYLREVVERLERIGSHPLGFRVAGTAEERLAVDYIAGELRSFGLDRSEERRVGKEWRFRWAPDHYNDKRQTS